MDGGKPGPRPYSEDAGRVLVAAARRAAARHAPVPGQSGAPVLVSGRDLLDALEGGAPAHFPTAEAARMTTLVKHVLDEAARVAAARRGTDITAADLGVAATRVMATCGIDARRIADARVRAHHA